MTNLNSFGALSLALRIACINEVIKNTTPRGMTANYLSDSVSSSDVESWVNSHVALLNTKVGIKSVASVVVNSFAMGGYNKCCSLFNVSSADVAATKTNDWQDNVNDVCPVWSSAGSFASRVLVRWELVANESSDLRSRCSLVCANYSKTLAVLESATDTLNNNRATLALVPNGKNNDALRTAIEKLVKDSEKEVTRLTADLKSEKNALLAIVLRYAQLTAQLRDNRLHVADVVATLHDSVSADTLHSWSVTADLDLVVAEYVAYIKENINK